MKNYLRPSDNVLFNVGDEVTDIFGKSFGKITKIWKSFDQVRIDIGNLGLVLYWPGMKDLIMKNNDTDNSTIR